MRDRCRKSTKKVIDYEHNEKELSSSMSSLPVVTCVGVITVDVIAIVRSFPEREGRVESDEIVITGGGPASNAAVVLAKQGVPTAVIGRVGDDAAGAQARALLDAYGIDTMGIDADPRVSTQTSCIVVDRSANTRSIMTTHLDPLLTLSERGRELVSGSQWVHTDHLGVGATVRLCSELDPRPRVSLDAGNAAIDDLDFSAIDLYVPTARTLRAVTGEEDLERAAATVLSAGCHAVVATDGANGCCAWWDQIGAHFGAMRDAGAQRSPAYRSSQIVSTLGAGDVFHGALLSALVHGCSWSEALWRANITAALSCKGRDGRESVPTQAQLETSMDRK